MVSKKEQKKFGHNIMTLLIPAIFGILFLLVLLELYYPSKTTDAAIVVVIILMLIVIVYNWMKYAKSLKQR